MQSGILPYQEITSDFLEGLRECARSAGSRLPFCQPDLTLAWWKNFSSTDGEPFGARRGRNFIGARSWLKGCRYLVAKKDGRICGAVPLASYDVRLPNSRAPFRMLTFAGDYVLAPYQDILALPEARREVLSCFVRECLRLMDAGHDLAFLGYIPEDSPTIPVLDEILERLPGNVFRKKCVTSQRGGVHPWTLASLQRLLLVLNYKVGADLSEESPVHELSHRLRRCSPDTLFFPRNRMELESGLQALVAAHAHEDRIRDEMESIHRLLGTRPIVYPYIELPADRQTYLARLGKKTRFNYRHQKKKLLGVGCSIEKIPSREVSESDILDYLHLHMMRWGARSVAISDRTMDFHRELCLSAAREGYLTLFFVRSGGTRIAAQSCFDIGDRREAYFTGLHPDYERDGAGIVLFHETILDAIDHSFARFEFGYGGDEYKFKFTRTTMRTYSYFLAKGQGMPDLDDIFLGFECMTGYADRQEHRDDLHT